MAGKRLRLAEERLVPFEAGRNVTYADDRPCAFHRISAVGLTRHTVSDSESFRSSLHRLVSQRMPYALAHLFTVSHVRVVTSDPKVAWISSMNTAPRGLGRYALNASRLPAANICAPSLPTGSDDFGLGSLRANVTTLFASVGKSKCAYGSASIKSLRCSTDRTMV